MIHVALVGDELYAAPMAVAIASISAHLKPSEAVTVHIFALDFSERATDRLRTSCMSPRVRMVFYTADPRLVDGFSTDVPFGGRKKNNARVVVRKDKGESTKVGTESVEWLVFCLRQRRAGLPFSLVQSTAGA